MIRPLRKLHVAVFGTLPPLIVVLYIVALAARPPAPVADLGENLVAPSPRSDARALAWSSPGVTGWWEPSSATVIVELATDFVSPDMLLYCAPPTLGDEVSPDASVIGAVRPGERRSFSLSGACGRGHEFFVFSLGHRMVLARAPFPSDEGGP